MDLTNNKNVRKTIKPLSTEKVTPCKKITLVENNRITFFDAGITKYLNNYFNYIIKELDVKVTEDLLCSVSDTEKSVEWAFEKYKNHNSIEKIKYIFGDKNICSFDLVFLSIMLQRLYLLKILIKLHTVIVKAKVDSLVAYLIKTYNESILGLFHIFKLADNTPFDKKIKT